MQYEKQQKNLDYKIKTIMQVPLNGIQMKLILKL